MKFLDDIRKQPQHIREIMFGLSVFITVLLIGMIWFRSFERNLYVLMNPEEDVGKALAGENVIAPSLFGYIWQTAGNVKGLISELLDSDAKDANERVNGTNNEENGKVYTLPLSDKK